MAQEYPLKRYKSYPARLIGNRQARFKDKNGHFAAFKPGKLLILIILGKTPPAASRARKTGRHKAQDTGHKPQKRKPSPHTRKSRPAGRKRQKSAKPAAKSPAPRKIKPKITPAPQKQAKSRKPPAAQLRKAEQARLYRAALAVRREAVRLIDLAHTIHHAVIKETDKKAALETAKPLLDVRKQLAKLISFIPEEIVEVRTQNVVLAIYACRYELNDIFKRVRRYIDELTSRLWCSTDMVLDELEREYANEDGTPNLKYLDVSGFTGEFYLKKDKWHKTIWPTQKIRPDMPIRSVYLFAIYTLPTYEDEFSFVGKHIGWNTTPRWLMDKLSEEGEPSYTEDEAFEERTILENLLKKVFLGCGEFVKLVGIKFSNKEAPKPKHLNPRRKKKR